MNTRTSGLFLEWCVRDVGPAALSALWAVDIVLAARFIADFEAEVARALREYARGRGGGFIFAQLCAIMRRQWRNLETAVLGTAVLAEDDGGLTAERRKPRDA